MTRPRHEIALWHTSYTSNGTAVTSNFRPAADGQGNVVWSAVTAGGSVSFGSNANDVSSVSAGGASSDSSRADHVHRGVTSVSHTSNTFYGPVILAAGTNIGITSPSSGTLTISSTGTGGGGGGDSGVVPWALISDLGIAHEAFVVVGASNRGIIVPATLTAAATLTGVRLRVGTSSGNISVGLYDASLNRVATSGAVACPTSGLATVNFSGNYSAAAGRYYIGLSANNNTATFSVINAASTASAISAKFMETAHPLPDPFVSAGLTSVDLALACLISGGWAP